MSGLVASVSVLMVCSAYDPPIIGATLPSKRSYDSSRPAVLIVRSYSGSALTRLLTIAVIDSGISMSDIEYIAWMLRVLFDDAAPVIVFRSSNLSSAKLAVNVCVLLDACSVYVGETEKEFDTFSIFSVSFFSLLRTPKFEYCAVIENASLSV